MSGKPAKKTFLYSCLPGTPHSGRGQHRGIMVFDGRTREAKHIQRVKKMLFEYLSEDGKEPTDLQKSLIERAAHLDLRCTMLEQKMIERTYTDYDSNVHFAAIGAMRRLYKDLGIKKEPGFASLMKKPRGKSQQPEAAD